MITTAAQARDIADRFLDTFVRPHMEEEIAITTVMEFATCWVVHWQSSAFVKSANMLDALAGGGPVIVNRRRGTARQGSSAFPAERQLDPD
jgi:hypothetical protein